MICLKVRCQSHINAVVLTRKFTVVHRMTGKGGKMQTEAGDFTLQALIGFCTLFAH